MCVASKATTISEDKKRRTTAEKFKLESKRSSCSLIIAQIITFLILFQFKLKLPSLIPSWLSMIDLFLLRSFDTNIVLIIFLWIQGHQRRFHDSNCFKRLINLPLSYLFVGSINIYAALPNVNQLFIQIIDIFGCLLTRGLVFTP